MLREISSIWEDLVFTLIRGDGVGVLVFPLGLVMVR